MSKGTLKAKHKELPKSFDIEIEGDLQSLENVGFLIKQWGYNRVLLKDHKGKELPIPDRDEFMYNHWKKNARIGI